MKRLVDPIILSLTGTAATALLLGLIARDAIGMTTDMVRVDGLSAAGPIFAAVAGGSLLKAQEVKRWAFPRACRADKSPAMSALG
jgi:hypothetical protein